MLSQTSPLPLYVQLARILKEEIERGRYRPGTALPSEIKLAHQYRIGRPTVREALRLLSQQGYLEKRKGSGSFVRPAQPEISLFSLSGSSTAFAEQGMNIKRRLIQRLILLTPTDSLNPFANQEVYFFSRLTYYKRQPLVFEEIWLKKELFPGLKRFDLAQESLAKIVQHEYYLEPIQCKQSFAVLSGIGLQADLLACPGQSLLFVSRCLYFKENLLGIFSRLYVRTDTYTFSQELNLTGLPKKHEPWIKEAL